jgi:ADP-ribose pyrophosphatase
MPPVKTLNSERRYTGRVFSLVVDEVEYPSGNRGIREVASHPGGAVVVALFDDDSILLVHQYRYPMKKHLLELPAGKLDTGEDPAVCAARELEEETGYAAGKLEKLLAIYTTPGFCDEQLHLYLATDLRPSHRGQQLEEGEMDLTVQRLPLNEALAMIERGEIIDGKTICGIFLTERRRRSDQMKHSGSPR